MSLKHPVEHPKNSANKSMQQPDHIRQQGEVQQQALEDIEYIKKFIQANQSKLDSSPPYLFVWGTYMMVGFLGMHFNVTVWPMWYWAIGSVIGTVLSILIGLRQTKQTTSREGGSYGWMFWVPFAAVLIAGGFLMFADIVRIEYLSVFWLVLLGVVYVSMGSLLGIGPVLLGFWFIVLAIVTRLFLLEYQFIVLGLLGGGSVILTAIWLLRRRRRYE